MIEGHLHILRESATRQQLINLLEVLTEEWSISAWRYQERLDAVELGWADRQWGEVIKQSLPGIWPIGRVFCWKFEIRWQASDIQSSRYEVQVTTERNLELPEGDWIVTNFEDAGEEYSTWLWGERDKNNPHYRETRIPGPQVYPVAEEEDKTMAAIQARDYRRNGIVSLTRLVRVKAANPEE